MNCGDLKKALEEIPDEAQVELLVQLPGFEPATAVRGKFTGYVGWSAKDCPDRWTIELRSNS